jgi:2-phospho-L-lactate guanylyltransferase
MSDTEGGAINSDRTAGRPAGASGTWAILPAKCFRRGKSRLGGVLSPAMRERFARGLFERVLRVATATTDGVLVATDCPDVARLARAHGAVPSISRLGLRASVDASLEALGRAGVARAVVLLSDLPRLEPRDVVRLCRLLDDHELAVAPDLRDEGTNALAVWTGTWRSSFGNTDSFARHLASTRDPAIYRHARTGLDVDTPADLARL